MLSLLLHSTAGNAQTSADGAGITTPATTLMTVSLNLDPWGPGGSFCQEVAEWGSLRAGGQVRP